MPQWTPMRSMTQGGQIIGPLQTATNAAQMASAWGQPRQMGYHLSDAYNLGFTARAMGENIPESAWRGIRAGRPTGGYISPYSPYLASWSPALPGSGIRGGPEGGEIDLDAIAEQVLAEMRR